jgi:tRNA 2-selenouridine synthase
VVVESPLAMRVALLKEEYAHFLDDPSALAARLAPRVPLHGRETIERWSAAAAAGDFDALVGDLLLRHYDPTYSRSIERNFPRHAGAFVARPEGVDAGAFAKLAREVILHAAAAHH